MFGHHYFGSRYFGPRYWGDGGTGIPVIPPVVPIPVGGGSRRPFLRHELAQRAGEIKALLSAEPEIEDLPDLIEPLVSLPETQFRSFAESLRLSARKTELVLERSREVRRQHSVIRAIIAAIVANE